MSRKVLLTLLQMHRSVSTRELGRHQSYCENRVRVGNASTCRDVCNLGAASDSSNNHKALNKHQSHGGSLVNVDHLTFAAQGKLAFGCVCEVTALVAYQSILIGSDFLL
ncbi:hypothetical protein Tco_0650143 [Tanacetum coccineum]